MKNELDAVGILETDQDIYAVDQVNISVCVGHYRMVDGKPRRIAQTMYQNIPILPSNNTAEAPWGPQIERFVGEMEKAAQEAAENQE